MAAPVRYADTCLLLSLHLRDPGTDAALTWLKDAGRDPIAVSHWSLTEFASALGIIVRRGELAPAAHAETMARFRSFVADRLILEPPEPSDFLRAADWLEVAGAGLRAGDALHLAICTRRSATLCTADASFARAAESFGLRVHLVA